MRFNEIFTSFDWILTGAVVLLVMVGLAMLFGTPNEGALISSRFVRQLFSLGVALVFYVGLSCFPYHYLKRYALPLYLAGLATLVVVSQMAPIIRGTTSRFDVYGFQIQPSEFIKIAIIVFLAWFFDKQGVNKWTVWLSALFTGAVIGLVILEPDFGEAALISVLWLSFVVYLGISWKTVAMLLSAGAAGLVGAWWWLFADYQKARLLTFINPSADPLGAGYNVMQSIVALGSGGIFGRGLGHGPQSQLKFLPEQHTDFILASIGEELGFIGITLVIVLYTVVLWRILRIANNTKDPFGQYLAVSVFLIVLISFFVSAGMNMGLLPVTGVPLPLVSYGGSHLVSSFVLLGVVQSVNIYSRWVRRPPLELTYFT